MKSVQINDINFNLKGFHLHDLIFEDSHLISVSLFSPAKDMSNMIDVFILFVNIIEFKMSCKNDLIFESIENFRLTKSGNDNIFKISNDIFKLKIISKYIYIHKNDKIISRSD